MHISNVDFSSECRSFQVFAEMYELSDVLCSNYSYSISLDTQKLFLKQMQT